MPTPVGVVLSFLLAQGRSAVIGLGQDEEGLHWLFPEFLGIFLGWEGAPLYPLSGPRPAKERSRSSSPRAAGASHVSGAPRMLNSTSALCLSSHLDGTSQSYFVHRRSGAGRTETPSS